MSRFLKTLQVHQIEATISRLQREFVSEEQQLALNSEIAKKERLIGEIDDIMNANTVSDRVKANPIAAIAKITQDFDDVLRELFKDSPDDLEHGLGMGLEGKASHIEYIRRMRKIVVDQL